MKKTTIVLFAVALILTGQMFADVVKKTNSEVNFTKFGRFSSVQTMQISEVKKATDSDNTFKGKGYRLSTGLHILYVGELWEGGTSKMRFNAMCGLCDKVTAIDISPLQPPKGLKRFFDRGSSRISL